jgi:hypothetical protein
MFIALNENETTTLGLDATSGTHELANRGETI